METGQCIVDRAVKLDTVDSATLDGGGADLDSIDVERILERACYGARRRRSIYQAPEFTKRLKTLENARTGEKVQFECHWTAFPRPAVKWYHDDEEINTDDDRFEIETQRRGVLILTLKSATRADEGSYKCKAENQEGVTSTTGYLSVTGDSRKSRSRESRRKRQRAVSLPPHLRTITEQRSLEETEEVACSRQPRSPIQDFLDNIESFRKDRTWPLLSRHHGADDKRMSTAQKWDDVDDSGESPAAAVVEAGPGAVGGKSSFERVLDNCENPFAKRPLLPFADDRVVTSEGDLTPNGRDLSPPSRPTSLWLGPAARNASDTCGRLPGRIVFPTSKKYKPIVVADVTSALKADAAEQTSPARKPAVPPKKPLAHRKPDGGLVVDGRQRGRVSPDGGRHTGDGRKPAGVRTKSKEKVYARVSGILCEDKTGDSAKVSMAGLADAIAACGWQGEGRQFADSDSTAPPQPADASESTAHPKPDESSASPVRSPSVDSGLRPKPVSIVSPVGTSVDADDVCPPPAVCRTEDVVPVPAPVTPTADSVAVDDIDAKTSARTCAAVAATTAASKADPQRPVLLYFFLFVTICAYVGCSLQSYPANFIFVVTALSMISFRLLLRRADFLGKS